MLIPDIGTPVEKLVNIVKAIYEIRKMRAEGIAHHIDEIDSLSKKRIGSLARFQSLTVI